jgi:hypothetical protein
MVYAGSSGDDGRGLSRAGSVRKSSRVHCAHLASVRRPERDGSFIAENITNECPQFAVRECVRRAPMRGESDMSTGALARSACTSHLAACHRGVRDRSAGARGSDSTSTAGGSTGGPLAIQAEDALAARALAGTLVVEGSDALRA